MQQRPLSQKRVLITAGPTRVYLDPIRYISNTASGTLGYELARQSHALGGEVTLVLGPSSLPDLAGVNIVRVETPEQMFEACDAEFTYSDIAIMNAAVSDYKPKTVATQKIKKTGDTLTLELERSIDILATLGQKKVHQLLIGFAAESENHLENARGKLIRKNADVIVANDLAHFNQQLHQATVITAKTEISLPKVAKAQLAQQLWQEFLKLI
ncbi:MAG: phosphopantothenoylcysteine decarboxylase, partial [Culicoidibacterales bacterium]